MTPENVQSYGSFVHTVIRKANNKLDVLKDCLSPKELTPETCSKILHHLVDEKAALYVACEEGHLDIIRYLVSERKVDIEQRGLYDFKDLVPPLWSCTGRNSIDVLRLLISLGADISCTSSTDESALMAGCLYNSGECVKELIKAGADVNTPNIYGVTALMNAASKGYLDLCEFLMNNGAEVQQKDSTGRTALHVAVEENRLDVVKLLIEKGCDCKLQNDTGENPFRLAALKAHHGIVSYLADKFSIYSVEAIETYELLGASYADNDKYEMASKIWLMALGLRGLSPGNPIPKQICDTLGKCTDHKEVSRTEEIGGLTGKEEFMMQSLLMRERILGPLHAETIDSLIYCGNMYTEMCNYRNCIQLWMCAYRRLVDQNITRKTGKCYLIQVLIKMCIDVVQEQKTKLHTEDLLDIFETIVYHTQFASTMFSGRPRTDLAAEEVFVLMKTALQLMNLLLTQDLQVSDMERLTYLAECAVKTGVRDEKGRTLLHLSMDEEASYTENYLFTWFPNFQVLKLLVEVGANINSMDNKRNTTLHYCAKPESHEAAGYLLDNQAHADVRNSDGESAIERLISSGYRVCPMEHCTLKCLAATAVNRHNITSWGSLPKTLHNFIELHKLA